MNTDLCDITIVLDRSGSMSSIQEETITGVNTFITEQKKVPGKAQVTLVQFDDRYQVDYTGVSIENVVPLSYATYVPRGYTALLDALGKTIISTGERLKNMPENERPGKVIFLIITDGQENNSKEFKKDQILEMVKHQTDVYKWEFVYVGANVDAFEEADAMGIAQTNAYGFSATSRGTKSLYSGLVQSTTSFRMGAKNTMAFTEEEKETIDSGK